MPDRPTESSDSVQHTPNPDKELMSVLVLRDKLALFEEALEAISDGFVLYDRDDRLLAFNSKHRDLFPFIAELLEPRVSHRALLDGQLRLAHFRIDPDKQAQWFSRRLHEWADPVGPVDQRFEDGRVIRLSEYMTASGGLIGVRSDITELSRAEEQLRKQHNLLLESLAEDVYGFDLEGLCTFANRSCVELLGFTDVTDLLGRDLMRVGHVPPPARATICARTARRVKTRALPRLVIMAICNAKTVRCSRPAIGMMKSTFTVKRVGQ